VVVTFPWLCDRAVRPPGHLTLLHWEDVRVSKELVEALRGVVHRYDHPYARRALPKLGQSFLFDPTRSPPVAPEGPLASLLRELDGAVAATQASATAGPSRAASTAASSSCGHVTATTTTTATPAFSGSSSHAEEEAPPLTDPALLKSVPLEALHTSAPLLHRPPGFGFGGDAALKGRHSEEENAWGQGHSVHELPFCLQFVAHLAPLPANELLFRWLLEHGVNSDAQRVANARVPVTSSTKARREIPGIGEHREHLLHDFFVENPHLEEVDHEAEQYDDEDDDDDEEAKEQTSKKRVKHGGEAEEVTMTKPKRAKTKKRPKKKKTVGAAPTAGHGGDAGVVGEVHELPRGMAAAPCVEYALTGRSQGVKVKGKALHVRFFLPATMHGRRGTGKVDPRVESLQEGAWMLKRLPTEPPGLRYLRWPDQQRVLSLTQHGRWDENSALGLRLKRRTDAFWKLFDALDETLTKPKAIAALAHNLRTFEETGAGARVKSWPNEEGVASSSSGGSGGSSDQARQAAQGIEHVAQALLMREEAEAEAASGERAAKRKAKEEEDGRGEGSISGGEASERHMMQGKDSQDEVWPPPPLPLLSASASLALPAPLDSSSTSPTRGGILELVHNLTDARAKKRFSPLPYKPLTYLVADAMLWGALPPCPLCGNSTLLGSPSEWTSCKGWISVERDEPCTFQTDKRLQYDAAVPFPIPTATTTTTTGGGGGGGRGAAEEQQQAGPSMPASAAWGCGAVAGLGCGLVQRLHAMPGTGMQAWEMPWEMRPGEPAAWPAGGNVSATPPSSPPPFPPPPPSGSSLMAPATGAKRVQASGAKSSRKASLSSWREWLPKERKGLE